MVRVLLSGLLLVLGARGYAGTVEGTIITNISCATFRSVQDTFYTTTWCSTATVLVVAPSVQIRKVGFPAMECPGATVTFCIYVLNDSDYTSAFNVVLNDELPDLLAYLRGQDQWAGNTPGATITQGYRMPGGFSPYCWPGIPAAFCDDEAPANSSGEPKDGQAGPGLRVRWRINMLGPNQSAMVCYKAVIL